MSLVASPTPPRSRSTSRPTYTPPSTSRRTPNRIPNPPYSISPYLRETTPESGRDIQQVIYRQKEAIAERKQNMAIKMHSPMKAYLDKIRQELLERIEYEVMQSEDPKSREFIASSYNASPAEIFSSTPPRTMISSSRSTPMTQFTTPTPSTISQPDSKASLPSPFPIIALDAPTPQNSDNHRESFDNLEDDLAPSSSFCLITLCLCTLTILFLMLSPITHQYLEGTVIVTPIPTLEISTPSEPSLPPFPSPTSDTFEYPSSYGDEMPRDPTLTYEYYSKNLKRDNFYPLARRKRRLSDLIGLPIRIIKKIFSVVFGFHRSL